MIEPPKIAQAPHWRTDVVFSPVFDSRFASVEREFGWCCAQWVQFGSEFGVVRLVDLRDQGFSDLDAINASSTSQWNL